MSRSSINTPVGIIIFNRPEMVRKLFDRVLAAEPPAIYIIADGPRDVVEDDEKLCREARAVVESVNGQIDIHKNYSDQNLGVKNRFTSGLSWLFDQTNEAIILEEDCLPHPDFFPFCEELLEEYRGDERVMDITGTNPLGKWKQDQLDYHYSYHGIIWGALFRLGYFVPN